jgi:hypothetical protein
MASPTGPSPFRMLSESSSARSLIEEPCEVLTTDHVKFVPSASPKAAGGTHLASGSGLGMSDDALAKLTLSIPVGALALAILL